MPDAADLRRRLVAELSQEERAQVEGVATLLAAAGPPVPLPPDSLEERTLAAIRAEAAGGAPEAASENGGARLGGHRDSPAWTGRAGRPGRSRLGLPRAGGGFFARGRLALAAGLALAVVAGALAGLLLSRDAGLPGTVELEATLRGPGANSVATATVRETGVGRVVDFRTSELPILPKGEYYELWFVGPGDRPGRPNRISAGTFHPDENGRSDQRFSAAVDPAKYPGLAVTAEPGDGNPRPKGPDVLRTAQP